MGSFSTCLFFSGVVVPLGMVDTGVVGVFVSIMWVSWFGTAIVSGGKSCGFLVLLGEVNLPFDGRNPDKGAC